MILMALPLLMILRPALLLALLVLLGGGVLVAVLPRRRGAMAADERQYPGLAALRRTTVTCRTVAVAVGIAAVSAVVAAGGLGVGAALAPATFAVVQVVGVLVADVLTRESARRPGSASLEVRQVRDYLPRGLTRVVGVLAAVLLGALAWTAAVAGPDDLGRAGRALAYTCAQGCDAGAHTPWPGSFYAVPMALGLVLLLGLGALAVRGTVRRPRDGSDEQLVRVDDAVRRRSVESVVAAVGIALSAGLLGIGLAAGAPVLADAHVPGSLRAGAGVLVVSGLAATPVLVWCVLVLLFPVATATPGRQADTVRLGAPA